MGERMAGYQHNGLQCEILKLEVDFNRMEAWLYFPADNCCDMTGCTSLIEHICPAIEKIYTRAGGWPDTAYFKVDGSWVALAYAGLGLGR
jgi:hypothetical protein